MSTTIGQNGNISADTLQLVLIFLTPHKLVACERVCKYWKSIIITTDATLWKYKLLCEYEDIKGPIYDTLIKNWITELRIGVFESWKMIYKVRYEWERFNLNETTGIHINKKPHMISTQKFPHLKDSNQDILQFKVGQIEAGNIHVPFDLNNTQSESLNQKICFKYRNRGPFAIDLSEFKFTYGFDMKNPFKFYSQPLDVSISFLSNSRTLLQILEETSGLTKTNLVRIWDPRVHSSPWFDSVDEVKCKIPGVWIIKGNFKFVSFCGRKVILRIGNNDQFSKLMVIELKEYNQWEYIHAPPGLETTANVSFCWMNTLCHDEKESVWSIIEILMNESIVAVLRQDKGTLKLNALIFNLSDGSAFVQFEPHLPTMNGFESTRFSFSITRFHFILYNCHFIVIYDLLRCKANKEPRIESMSKLPYVGRNVRIEFSEDSSMFLLTPMVQHGEVVLIDIIKRTCTSYLLQNGYVGTSPKKGCWLVFDRWKNSACNVETRVIWSPIEFK